MKLAFTARFKKAWSQLEEADKKLAVKALQNLAGNLKYPALRVKKIQGVNNIWEARASRSIRITFQFQGDTLILRNIGKHDETIKKP